MSIYTGNWIIVIRKERDSTSRGKIIEFGLSETWAKEQAKQLAKDPKFEHYNVWAMQNTSF